MKRTLLIIMCALSCVVAFGQWSADPEVNNLITPPDVEIYDKEIAVNDDGVTYFLYTRPMSNTASFIQIFDKEGYPVFDDYGFKFSHFETWSWTMVNDFLYVDNEGNAVICVTDCRYSDEGRLSFTAYKISPTGEMLWGELGVNLDPGNTYALSAKLTMVTLEDGSHVFAWIYVENNDDQSMSIKMQRLSGDGEILWDSPIALTSATVQYSYPYLVNAGYNQYIMVYAKGSNQDLTAMKYDFDGEPVWAKEAVMYQGGFGGTPIWTQVQVIPDQKGGVFAAWHDDRFFTNFETSYASYIKSDGTHGFIAGTGGQALAYNAELGVRCMYPKITFDPVNDHLYATWVESSSGQTWCQEVVQKLDLSGQLLWGPEAKVIWPMENRRISYNSIQMAEPGKFVAFYMMNPGIYEVDAIATKIDGETGDYVWKGDHLYISKAIGTKANLETTRLTNDGFWMSMWDVGERIYAQRIFSGGVLYNPVGIKDVKNVNSTFALWPTVVESEVTFSFNNTTEGRVNISIYTMGGQKAAVVYNGNTSKGEHQVKWNAKDYPLNKGIYLAVITTPDKKESIKFVVK